MQMRKEELRKLRALPATKAMMEKGKRFKEVEERSWSGKKLPRLYRNMTLCSGYKTCMDLSKQQYFFRRI